MTLELPKLDYNTVQREIVDWIKKIFHSTKAKGVVLGLSGGVDSAVTVTLLAEALNEAKVMALIMPTSFTPTKDTEDALELSNLLRLKHEVIQIDGMITAYKKNLKTTDSDRVTEGNLIARIRMSLSYYYANKLKYLVAGTGDRSEYLIGFFTKFGDGAADMYPITHLYKTQVRELCRYLNIKEGLCRKPSSPMLWPGHKAIDEIPVDYPTLDRILYALYDLQMDKGKVAKKLNLDIKLINDIERRNTLTQHKRSLGYMLSGFSVL